LQVNVANNHWLYDYSHANIILVAQFGRLG
jgi:hypothetical protein